MLAAPGSSFIRRFKVQVEFLWVEFLVNARLRAVRILLVVYAHHVTSKSRDIRIYAWVVLPTDPTMSDGEVQGLTLLSFGSLLKSHVTCIIGIGAGQPKLTCITISFGNHSMSCPGCTKVSLDPQHCVMKKCPKTLAGMSPPTGSMDCRQPTHISTPWHPTIHTFSVTVNIITATCTGATTIPRTLLGNRHARNLMFDGVFTSGLEGIGKMCMGYHFHTPSLITFSGVPYDKQGQAWCLRLSITMAEEGQDTAISVMVSCPLPGYQWLRAGGQARWLPPTGTVADGTGQWIAIWMSSSE